MANVRRMHSQSGSNDALSTAIHIAGGRGGRGGRERGRRGGGSGLALGVGGDLGQQGHEPVTNGEHPPCGTSVGMARRVLWGITHSPRQPTGDGDSDWTRDKRGH